MSEETQFWGVVAPRLPAVLWPQGTGLLPWRGRGPDGKAVHYYPLFSSRERAAAFVNERGRELDLHLVDDVRANLRRIYRDEIPEEHYVNLDGQALVTWGQLQG